MSIAATLQLWRGVFDILGNMLSCKELDEKIDAAPIFVNLMWSWSQHMVIFA